jgi:hypothetical protein
MIVVTIKFSESPRGFVEVDLMAPPSEATAAEIKTYTEFRDQVFTLMKQRQAFVLRSPGPPSNPGQN